ncbi:MAG: hypothetical protein E6J54_26135 [Deltaproteobacteria bacterium]|nr:MAG: hypothetical protein E6J54_26135 [Deltaproteobacteria bacterium]
MYSARSILVILFFLSSLSEADPGLGFEDGSSITTQARTSPALQSSQASNVLRQIAIGLSGGSEAMRALRGAPDEDARKYRLHPTLPEMNCSIDRILSYLSCYGAVINNEKEAENVFKQLVDDVKAALPAGRWEVVKVEPRVGSVRSITYEDRKSARIDIELLVSSTMEVQSSYVVSLYGWPRF